MYCDVLTIVVGTEFWSSCKTLQTLRETGCFDVEDDKESFSWPQNFQPFINQGLYTEQSATWGEEGVCGNIDECIPPDDPLGLTAASDYELAVSALGACVWYLQRCFIDKALLSMKSFQVCTFYMYMCMSVFLFCQFSFCVS